ncbi:MAG: ferrochelatase [Acidobacteria bacterium]|nr:ferrochelatase [Acidobacteriota bacterium]
MAANDDKAVLLLAHGSPDSPAGIPEFLRNVTGGRPMPPAVVEEIRHRYELIGGSPLHRITERQAQLLRDRLDLPVYVGMRNWPPYIPDTVGAMQSAGVVRAVSICLAPHNSRTSVGLYRKALFERPHDGLEIAFVESWHDHPLLVRAFVERLREAWPAASSEYGRPLPLIFTAHSVPQRTVQEGDPYEQQTRHTAELVAGSAPELGPGNWSFAFQSQGMSGGPWLGPTVEDTILELKAAGHSGVFIQPIGFVSDHVEVLYDIDIAFRQFAASHGMRLWRAGSLNDSPIFADALADLARSRLG